MAVQHGFLAFDHLCCRLCNGRGVEALFQQALVLQDHNGPDGLLGCIQVLLLLHRLLLQGQAAHVAGLLNFLTGDLQLTSLLGCVGLQGLLAPSHGRNQLTSPIRLGLTLDQAFPGNGRCCDLLTVYCRNPSWKQRRKHAQCQQEGKYAIHSFHIQLLLLQLFIAAENRCRLRPGGAAPGGQDAEPACPDSPEEPCPHSPAHGILRIFRDLGGVGVCPKLAPGRGVQIQLLGAVE